MSSHAFLERLSRIARTHGIELDAAQRGASVAFARLARDLSAAQNEPWGLLARFRRRSSIRGIYLWGPVGRGKSFLMDAFFEAAPTPRKQRVHFHRFMQHIHRELRVLQGQEEPLRIVAQRVAQEIVEDLLQAVWVGVDFERFSRRLHSQRDVLLRGQWCVEIGKMAQNCCHG